MAWAVFVPALAVWTWKLLEPSPVPEPVLQLLSIYDWLPFLLAKCLHGGGYAFLTALVWVAVPSRWRKLAMVFMLLHGAGTELLQHLLPFNRYGCVRDVVIDWSGVAVGAGVAWGLLKRPHS